MFSKPASSQFILKEKQVLKLSLNYLEKMNFQNILTIEEDFYDKKPSKVVSKIFPKDWFFKPWDILKLQSFYQVVLKSTGSAKFKHFKKNEKNLHPSYSTCIIQKIIHPIEWSSELYRLKPFPPDLHTRINHFQFFNYLDYQ